MRSEISSINDRMDTLKTSSDTLGDRLQDLVAKHDKHNSAVDGFNDWCGDAEKKLSALEREPVGSEPVFIKKQIDRVKVIIKPITAGEGCTMFKTMGLYLDYI